MRSPLAALVSVAALDGMEMVSITSSVGGVDIVVVAVDGLVEDVVGGKSGAPAVVPV